MSTLPRLLVLLILCLVPASLAIAADAPAAAPAPWCPQATSAEEAPNGHGLDLDPLQGAEQQTCSATATCNNYPSVSCVGVNTCASYDGGCPNQWRGMVICDGVNTHCQVNDSCVSACDAERATCRSWCDPWDKPCLTDCQLAYHSCLCGCN